MRTTVSNISTTILVTGFLFLSICAGIDIDIKTSNAIFEDVVRNITRVNRIIKDLLTNYELIQQFYDDTSGEKGNTNNNGALTKNAIPKSKIKGKVIRNTTVVKIVNSKDREEKTQKIKSAKDIVPSKINHDRGAKNEGNNAQNKEETVSFTDESSSESESTSHSIDTDNKSEEDYNELEKNRAPPIQELKISKNHHQPLIQSTNYKNRAINVQRNSVKSNSVTSGAISDEESEEKHIVNNRTKVKPEPAIVIIKPTHKTLNQILNKNDIHPRNNAVNNGNKLKIYLPHSSITTPANKIEDEEIKPKLARSNDRPHIIHNRKPPPITNIEIKNFKFEKFALLESPNINNTKPYRHRVENVAVENTSENIKIKDSYKSKELLKTPQPEEKRVLKADNVLNKTIETPQIGRNNNVTQQRVNLISVSGKKGAKPTFPKDESDQETDNVHSDDSSGTTQEDDFITKQETKMRQLRNEYLRSCVGLVSKKCFKASKNAVRRACSSRDCKDDFKTRFRRHARARCYGTRDYYGNYSGSREYSDSNLEWSRMGRKDQDQPRLLEDEAYMICNPDRALNGEQLKETKKAPNVLSMLRNRYERGCKKSAARHCRINCRGAAKQTSDELKSKQELRNKLAHNCKKECNKIYRIFRVQSSEGGDDYSDESGDSSSY